MKKTALFPLYLPTIFSGAKSFRDNPVIGSRILNLCGLHVFRILLADTIYKIRRIPFTFGISSADRKSFNENGFVQRENFLPQELFTKIQNEVLNYNGKARQCVQGDTITWRVFLDDETLENLPALKMLAENKQYNNLIKYASAYASRPLLYIQQIQNRVSSDFADPQKNLHSDTFHPNIKAWLFLEDVTPEKGPFTYVPGSQKISSKRLKWEYKKSVNGKNLNDRYSEKGSFRLTEQDRVELGFNEPKAFTVKKNTLVVGNTNGFHARGDVQGENVTRLEIWAYTRPSPFNPFPGVDAKIFRVWRNNLFKKYLERMDEKAAKRNAKSSWHISPNNSVITKSDDLMKPAQKKAA
jgi:hypothetical protein